MALLPLRRATRDSGLGPLDERKNCALTDKAGGPYSLCQKRICIALSRFQAGTPTTCVPTVICDKAYGVGLHCKKSTLSGPPPIQRMMTVSTVGGFSKPSTQAAAAQLYRWSWPSPLDFCSSWSSKSSWRKASSKSVRGDSDEHEHHKSREKQNTTRTLANKAHGCCRSRASGVPTVEEWSREGIEASPLVLQWEKRGRPKGLPPGASDERIGLGPTRPIVWPRSTRMCDSKRSTMSRKSAWSNQGIL